MKKTYFESYYDLADDIFETALQEDGADVAYIGDYESVKSVLKNFIYVDDGDLYNLFNLELENVEVTGYDGPFILMFSCDGDIWCQRAVVSNMFVKFEDDIVYVQPKYYAAAIQACINDDTEFKVVAVKDEEFEEDDCNRNDGFKIIAGEDDDEPHGFQYNYDGDGYCIRLNCCFCEPQDIDRILEIYNKVAKAIS